MILLFKFKAPGIGQGSTVTVVDGESTDGDADRVEFCGYKSPPDFVSSGRNLHIMLKQELQPHGKGIFDCEFFYQLYQTTLSNFLRR